ncbi:MAG: SH3 domain-containing protein [Proteobacteria bacterium]|nr:SH3 domain-containing protein [Pseudomonadota bacterium]
MKAKPKLAPISPGGQPQKGDKIEVVKVLVIAVISFLLGFALVILFLRPTHPSSGVKSREAPSETSIVSSNERIVPTNEPARQGYAPKDSPSKGYAPDLSASSTKPADEDGEFHEGNAPPEVPPGKTPQGVSVDGLGFYLKCWDENGQEHPGGSCDRLRVLEKRFSTRLYVIDRCKKRHASNEDEGKLSLGMEVDFEKMALSFWNGASSSVKNAAKITTCLRGELAGLPIHGFDHKYSRYRIFFTVIFGKAVEKGDPTPGSAAASKPPRKKGKLKEVIKDRVRVRRTPKDGEVIGKISTGNQVQLLEKKQGWCRVITPNNNEGWMICDALK